MAMIIIHYYPLVIDYYWIIVAVWLLHVDEILLQLSLAFIPFFNAFQYNIASLIFGAARFERSSRMWPSESSRKGLFIAK